MEGVFFLFSYLMDRLAKTQEKLLKLLLAVSNMALFRCIVCYCSMKIHSLLNVYVL
jgi:hypothetical protein